MHLSRSGILSTLLILAAICVGVVIGGGFSLAMLPGLILLVALMALLWKFGYQLGGDLHKWMQRRWYE